LLSPENDRHETVRESERAGSISYAPELAKVSVTVFREGGSLPSKAKKLGPYMGLM